jgi:hypothetical protein
MRKLLLLFASRRRGDSRDGRAGIREPIRTNGKIVVNSDNHTTGKEEVYTVDPDGTNRHLVGVGETGQWSRDGTRIAIGLDCCGGGIMNVRPATSRLFTSTRCIRTASWVAALGQPTAHGLPAKA